MKALLICMVAALLPHGAAAQAEAGNKISVTATSIVTYDRDTGLFTYTYSLSSGGESLQEIDSLKVATPSGVALNVRAPKGWTGDVRRDGRMVSWCACAEEGIIVPPGWIDNGQIIPSVYQIKPGQSLAGFSFQSPDPPAQGTFYAQGFVQIPIEGIDFPPGEPPDVPTFPNDSVAGVVQAPLRVEGSFPGGRRPAVDGFLVFLTISDNDSRTAPVLIDLVLGQNGEAVFPETFRAELNGTDITQQFIATSTNRRRAYLQLGSGSALKIGANVLTTSVEGLVPGASRTATDTDRVKFVVQGGQ